MLHTDFFLAGFSKEMGIRKILTSMISEILAEADTEQEAEEKSVVCWYMTASTSQNKRR